MKTRNQQCLITFNVTYAIEHAHMERKTFLPSARSTIETRAIRNKFEYQRWQNTVLHSFCHFSSSTSFDYHKIISALLSRRWACAWFHPLKPLICCYRTSCKDVDKVVSVLFFFFFFFFFHFFFFFFLFLFLFFKINLFEA